VSEYTFQELNMCDMFHSLYSNIREARKEIKAVTVKFTSVKSIESTISVAISVRMMNNVHQNALTSVNISP